MKKFVLIAVAMVMVFTGVAHGMSSHAVHNPTSEAVSCTAMVSDNHEGHDLIGMKCDKGSKDYIDLKQMVLVSEDSMCIVADVRDTHPEYTFVALYCEAGIIKDVQFGAPAFIKSNVKPNKI